VSSGVIESRAQALQARQELLTTELQRSDLQMQLNDAIGLPLTTALLLDANGSTPSDRCERDACIVQRWTRIRRLRKRAQVEKAESAVRPARYEFAPDVEVFARYSFQRDVPFLAAGSARSACARATTCSTAGAGARLARA